MLEWICHVIQENASAHYVLWDSPEDSLFISDIRNMLMKGNSGNIKLSYDPPLQVVAEGMGRCVQLGPLTTMELTGDWFLETD